MWCLRLCVMACMWMTVAATKLRCEHPQCTLDSVDDYNYEFSVEGHKVYISVYKKRLYLECGERHFPSVLDSPAMPRFTNELRVSAIRLALCALPAAGSIVDKLAALNVKVVQNDDEISELWYEGLPPKPTLTAQHFTGLEHLEWLGIHAIGFPQPVPSTGFLAELRNLRKLVLLNVQLPVGELLEFPMLRSLTLNVANVEWVPESLLTLPELREVVLRETRKNSSMSPMAPSSIALNLTNTLKVYELPALETLVLVVWSEPRPSALTRCDGLKMLKLDTPAAKELPERWVAACPHLKILWVECASFLVSLPPKLLEGASELTHLIIKRGVLETLPEGLLDFTPNLLEVDLTDNHLHKIPSDVFLGPRAMFSLNLSCNQLDNEVLGALAPLRSLGLLKLDDNPRLSDLCDDQGYSPLLNLTQLNTLSLRNNNISRICRDWRVYFTRLEILDLQNTQISELRYSDLQYKRDETVTNPRVLLAGAPITAVQYTEDDYKRSLTAAPTDATVILDSQLECDCRMYWTRMALDRADTLMIQGARCADNRTLTDLTADDMCPDQVFA